MADDKKIDLEANNNYFYIKIKIIKPLNILKSPKKASSLFARFVSFLIWIMIRFRLCFLKYVQLLFVLLILLVLSAGNETPVTSDALIRKFIILETHSGLGNRISAITSR
jgi:hypothetical protein